MKKKRVLFLILFAVAVSSCTSIPEGTGTSTSDPEIEQPMPESTETEVDPTAETIDVSIADESGTSDSEVNADGSAVGLPQEVLNLPDRDDTIGLAAYCWQNPGNCAGKGDPNAPVIMVEVSDYGCGHCRNFNLETAGEIDDLYIVSGDVYWLVLPYALSPARTATPASALCAAEQDAFYEYHQRMFEMFSDKDAQTNDGYYRAAGELGLDLPTFQECVESGRYQAVVSNNILVASAFGVTSTPTIVLDAQALVGNYPLESIRQWIDAEIDAHS
ncbi:MAG TPA: thioredoxin domain-containing protein [candidate division Zixibacteria bacterium]|nr:thioredoxin domain-containing protein [candidate division Zixibacteria bacterium]